MNLVESYFKFKTSVDLDGNHSGDNPTSLGANFSGIGQIYYLNYSMRLLDGVDKRGSERFSKIKNLNVSRDMS